MALANEVKNALTKTKQLRPHVAEVAQTIHSSVSRLRCPDFQLDVFCCTYLASLVLTYTMVYHVLHQAHTSTCEIRQPTCSRSSLCQESIPFVHAQLDLGTSSFPLANAVHEPTLTFWALCLHSTMYGISRYSHHSPREGGAN